MDIMEIFLVSPDIEFNVGETVITISYGELNHTFTVTGLGGYSTAIVMLIMFI